jgi:hypothetical protein
MCGTTETYGTDHSGIFSEQVKNNFMVHIITYRYRWSSYPLYSKYNSGVFQLRCSVECDITCKVNIIVTVRDSTVHYNETQPTKAAEHGNIPCTE